MSLKYKHSLLFVDDEESITNSLKRIFRKEGFLILTATSGEAGLDVLKNAEKPVSLIISDQRMPNMSGSEFLEKVKDICPHAARILLTGYSDMNATVDAINKGEIHRYLTKPWDDEDIVIQVKQALMQVELVAENRRLMALTKSQNRELKALNESLEGKVKERTEEIKQKNTSLSELNIRLEKSIFNAIRLLSSTAATFDPGLGKFMNNIAPRARDIAVELGLPQDECDLIEMAGMIYDIGLLGVSEKIWKKDLNDLDEHELKIFTSHPVIAATCLGSVERLSEVSKIILHHHENYDGSGFPNGLKGHEIPIGSRIIAVVSDYFKIVDFWPKDVDLLINKTTKYFGIDSKKISITEPSIMLEEIAQKIILLGAHHKYDIEVITIFMKKMEQAYAAKIAEEGNRPRIASVELDNLKDGMVLMKDLRLKDNRLLLVKGAMLNQSSIATIQKLGNHNLIEKRIFVSS